MKLLNRFLLLGVIVGIITILVMLGFRPPSFCVWDCGTGSYTQQEVECMASAMLVDTAGEEVERVEAQYVVGKALRQYVRTHERDMCVTFEQGLMHIPIGYKRTGLYVGRDTSWVSREFSADWGAAVKRATEIAKIPREQLTPGTHIIRAVRSRGWVAKLANLFAVDTAAESQIRSTMVLVPKPATAKYRLELFRSK